MISEILGVRRNGIRIFMSVQGNAMESGPYKLVLSDELALENDQAEKRV